ncbi:ATP-binding protein [Roseospira goensis]|uniref:histidine kinase n=1 Tax=Roseospira goensis TaxID=391922 RepID=A0A7W6S2V8_9PROT|nr:ATP-binding protein [Roseospira goensis]MBB4287885.1 signal transduction histidine kinase [Roseospira goensis]
MTEDAATRRARRRRRIPWPSSLAGQTILVLLVGLTLSHLLALGLYSFDRLRLLEMLGGRVVVSRVAEAVRLVETAESPRAERRLQHALSGGRLWVRIADTPIVAASEAAPGGLGGLRTRFLERALAMAFAGEPARIVRVGAAPAGALLPPGRPARMMPHAVDPSVGAPGPGASGPGASGMPGMGHPMPRWGRAGDPSFREGLHRLMMGDPDEQALAVSVALADGRWLNVVAQVPRPQGFWTPGALASMGLMSAVILTLSVWAVRRTTRPLRAVAEAARRMGVDPRRDPLPETGSRELREVARAFNTMQERLSRLVDNRTRLLAAISHDLRTPITTLKLRAEFIEDAEERARMLATLDEMEHMVRATLDFARDDVAAEPARPVDLAALVAALCDDLAETGRPVTLADGTGDTTESAPAPAAVIRGRPTALRRAVTNLVINACTHGGGARVRLEPAMVLDDGPGWAVVVRDDGAGIPEDHLARVTDPFYRVEGSRARSTGGIGLGLSIVQAVADAHGGRLVLRNRPEGGLEARLEVPAGRPARGAAAS